MSKMPVAILFGGESSEYEVSLRSAYTVLNEIDKEKYIIYKIGITKNGEWFLFNGDNGEIPNDTWHKNPKNKPLCVDFSRKSLISSDTAIAPEVIFPVMHGEYGEDGRIQALCELLKIKKVGISTDSAVLCMDKHLSKTVAMRELIPVVPFIAVKKSCCDLDGICAEIGESLGDVFVKPTKGGSSVGISRVHTRAELERALDVAFEYSDTVLIEEAINGCECEVAVLESDGALTVSEVGSVSYDAEFYDYNTKYACESVRYSIPAKIEDVARDLCRKYARELFKALNCHGMSRVDFFVDGNSKVYFNEINAIPGFTDISMYPMLMSHAGYSLGSLIDVLIENAR